MLALLKVTNTFPLWLRVAITCFALGAAYLFQIPLETEVPGEPFLLFFAILVGCTLAFGRITGFLAVVVSSLLSLHFFEPGRSIDIYHASDLIKVELYALFSVGAVVVIARLNRALIAAEQANLLLANQESQKSVLLAELAHRVANNFAALAALIRQKSNSVADPQAKSALEEALRQVNVMARIHGHLRAGNKDVSFDSRRFLEELCEDFRASVASLHSISIECAATSHLLPAVDALPLGLILNELITNAIKYAFPNGRAGTIRVSLDKFGDHLRLCVQDDGVGLRRPVQGKGLGHSLVHALAQQLDASVEIKADGSRGTAISITFDTDPWLKGALRNIQAGLIPKPAAASRSFN
jgi:two-component sensor histidine kinase